MRDRFFKLEIFTNHRHDEKSCRLHKNVLIVFRWIPLSFVTQKLRNLNIFFFVHAMNKNPQSLIDSVLLDSV